MEEIVSQLKKELLLQQFYYFLQSTDNCKPDFDKMTEEWLDKRYLKDMGVRKPCKQAFLAGLETGLKVGLERTFNILEKNSPNE